MQHFGDRIEFIRDYLRAIFAGDVHSKRINTLAGATLGVMTSASLAVSVIGHALAQARCRLTKHAIKQVDRLLSNQGVVVWDMFGPWVTEMVGQRRSIVVAMDWTDFDADDQTTLALNLVTNHGRATPLLWLTVFKGELKAKRNDYEDLCLLRLAEALPEGAVVTILADRGFGDVKLFAFLDELGFDYVIRFRGNIHVAAADGETRLAADWVGKGGRARKIPAASVTAGGREVGSHRLRPRQRHEGSLVLGHQPRRGERAPNHQFLRQALDDRTRVSRHEGPSLRHGDGCPANLRAPTARQAASPQRLRDRSLDAARRRRRKSRHGPPSQVQHRQASHPFALPPGLHALRTDPDYARTAIATPMERFGEIVMQNSALEQTFSVV